MRIRKSQSAFTIVELLVVIVVIGILAAITIVSYTGITQKANIAVIQSDLSGNSNILKAYNATYGSYPTTLNASNCPTAPTADNNYCLKASSGITLSYQPSSITNATEFSLYASKNSTYYRTSSDTAMTTQPVSKVCPYGFIVVPGSSTYGTSDFCVMKYEAKQVGTSTTPISTASGTPWVNINQTTASTNAANVAGCTGCHLITEAEWMTIAKNVLSVASNWSTGIVGSGYIFSGHNDSAPEDFLAASSNDSDGYHGTGNATGSNQKRTLTLTNGEVVWDLAGNVVEWTAGQTTGGQPGVAAGGYGEREWTAITTTGTLAVNPFPSGTGLSGASVWNSSNGIGQIYSSVDDTELVGFNRGGDYYSSDTAGVLALDLSVWPWEAYSTIGWRVSSPGL